MGFSFQIINVNRIMIVQEKYASLALNRIVFTVVVNVYLHGGQKILGRREFCIWFQT
ncbi:unnamed protein product [Trifolium pratense]|uniref:Uncharacterized protein n=1 Tax=Trifolium pratense TaxID=57577 RepID=A0ACB0L9A6_TRIPR|nr:unnamed protein product [Trifolium pratense]